MRWVQHIGFLSVALGSAGLIGCSDPEFESDLNSEGPPRITTVTIDDVPTFCNEDMSLKVNRDLCPVSTDEDGNEVRAAAEPYLEGFPAGWTVRVVFSELLDADLAEELITEDCNGDGIDDQCGHLSNTKPLVITCGENEVTYDGYYDPTGSHLTLPPGPALVVTSTDYVAAGSACSVGIRPDPLKVMDKDGNAPVEDDMGKYDFGLAILAPFETSPADTAEEVAVETPIVISYNGLLDAASLEGKVTVKADDVVVPVTLTLDESTTSIVATPDAPLPNGATITVEVAAGVLDVAGANADAGITFSFTTAPAA